jgi:hypothetical protein
MKAAVSIIVQEMKSWREEAKVYSEEWKASSEEMKSVAVHEEVTKEDAAVKTIRARNKWYVDRQLAVGRRRQPKKRTQGNGGARKELAAVRGQLTGRANPARLKEHGRQVPGKVSVVQGTHKGRTFGTRSRVEPQCNSGIRNRDLK